MNTEPRYPPIHITRTERIGDKQVESVITSPVCDFCMDAFPTWDYQCASFEIEEIDFGSQDGWAACNVCSEFIERDMNDELLDRAMLFAQKFGLPQKRESLRLIQDGFRAHRKGGRIAFE